MTKAMATAVDTLTQGNDTAARAHWGISIIDAATGATLFARNDAQYFEPASNAKLFTTSAALALLGPTYTLSTQVLAEGTVDAAGTLHGDLRIIGGADPTLSGRAYPWSGHTERPNPPLAALDALAAQVLAAGIHAIDGPILADDSIFADERYGHGWAWDDLQWEYGAPISALPINDDVRYLTVTPSTVPDQPLTAEWLPDLPGLPPGLGISGTTSTPGTRPALGIAHLFNSEGFRVYGTLPVGGAPVHLGLAIDDPARFAGQAFRAALVAKGITSQGSRPFHRPSQDTESFTLETHEPVVLHPLPPGSTSLPAQLATVPQAPVAPQSGGTTKTPAARTIRMVASRTSVPLSDIITVTNKVSQNLHAELLLRILGRAEGSDGTSAQGARIVRAFATTQAGVLPDDFLLYDGSGLSSDDLVTPRALTTLLRYSTTQSWGPILRDSLPIAGVDGTLSSRFPALQGRLQAKTGTLGEVDSLSGFLTTDSGRLLIFSVLSNDHPEAGARATIDAVVEATAHTF
jgi:D-alanyl-D-alanine carboxypeptidase/D-alanyl-D-alanine-endopeptidase (penicillin-binding protein 4)